MQAFLFLTRYPLPHSVFYDIATSLVSSGWWMNVRARIMLYNQVSGHRSSFIGFEPPIGPLPVSQNQLVKSWCNIAYAPTVCSYLTYRTLVIFAISLELHVYNKVYKYKIFKRLRERERERERIFHSFLVFYVAPFYAASLYREWIWKQLCVLSSQSIGQE